MIPDGWREAGLESHIELLSGFAFPSKHFTEEPSGPPLVRIRDLESGRPDTHYSGDFHERFVIPTGSILIGMDGDFSAVKWEEPGCLLNQRVLRVSSASPGRLDDDFLYYRLKRELPELQRIIGGTTVKHLSQKHIKSLRVTLPPLAEQRKIAAILSSVDDAIVATRKVIEQTKRLKQGLLQTLMTRGIGHTRFKNTSIGEIPETWDVVRLEQVATLQRGFDITVKEQNHGDVPVVSSSGVNSWHDQAKVDPPGVVTGRKGALGSVYYLSVPFWPHDTSLWVSDFHGNDAHWVAWLLRSLRLERYNAATSVPTLNRNNVHPLRVRRPPPREQKAIAEVLSLIEGVSGDQEEVIGGLTRLKRGLMQDLLTGRVRVQPD